MVHHGHEAMLIQFDQFLERAGLSSRTAQHEADVRIAEGQLRAGLAGRCHNLPPKN